MRSAITGTPENFELVTHVKPAPLFVNATFTFFAAAFFSIPFFITALGGFTPSLIFVFAMTTVAAFFILKFALWNSRGREIIVYNGEMLTQQYDYGYYRSKPLEFRGELTSVLSTESEPTDIDSETLDGPDKSEVALAIFLIGEEAVGSTLPVETALLADFFGTKYQPA
jgi:hypothetical protein